MKKATNKELAQYIGLYLAFVAGIHVVDGPWRHWSKGRSIDMWTWTHIAWGFLGARMNQSLSQQVTLASINEVAEALIRRYRPDLVWGSPEPYLNVPVDVAANAAGWYLGKTTGRGLPRR